MQSQQEDQKHKTHHKSKQAKTRKQQTNNNARPESRLNTSMTDLVPVQRMNARIPELMWLSQQPWSTDRIEYN